MRRIAPSNPDERQPYTEADVGRFLEQNGLGEVPDRCPHEEWTRDHPQMANRLQEVAEQLCRASTPLPVLTQKEGAMLDAMARSNLDAPVTGPDLYKTEHLAKGRYEYDADTRCRVLRNLRRHGIAHHVDRRGYLLRVDTEGLPSGPSWRLLTRVQRELLQAFSWECIELALASGDLPKPRSGELMRIPGTKVSGFVGKQYNGDIARTLAGLASPRCRILAHERRAGFWVNQWPEDAEVRPHWSVVVGGRPPSTPRSELVRMSLLRAIARATREVVCPIRRRDFIRDRTLQSIFRANRLVLQQLGL